MEEWIEDIVENTHYRDVETLRFKLDEAIESHNREVDEQLYSSQNWFIYFCLLIESGQFYFFITYCRGE